MPISVSFKRPMRSPIRTVLPPRVTFFATRECLRILDWDFTRRGVALLPRARRAEAGR